MDFDGIGPRLARIEGDQTLILAALARLGLQVGDNLTAAQRVARANGEPDHVVEAMAPQGEGRSIADVDAKAWAPSKEEFESILSKVNSLSEQFQALAVSHTTLSSFREDLNKQAALLAEHGKVPHDKQVADHVAETLANASSNASSSNAASNASSTTASAPGTTDQPNGNHPHTNGTGQAKPAVDGAREAIAANTQAPAGEPGVGSNGQPLAQTTDNTVHGTLDGALKDQAGETRPPHSGRGGKHK